MNKAHTVWKLTASALLVGGMSFHSIAQAQVSVPHVFENGTPADADEVNDNFNAVVKGINAVGDGAKGDKGDKGDKGETGATGAKGEQGPKGDSGDGTGGKEGPAGPQGEAGPKGEKGDAGPAGATGGAGPQGVTGGAGPQGKTGGLGPQGATGGVGPQGASCSVGACTGGEAELTCGTSAPVKVACASPTKTVFVTSETYTGNLGGLAGADAKCQSAAFSSPFTTGTYKAWLSDSTGSPDTRFSKSTVPYVLVDGTMIAASYKDLTSRTPMNTISHDEFGRLIVPEPEGGYTGVYAWTGTSSYGKPLDRTCSDWTDDKPTFQGGYAGRVTADPFFGYSRIWAQFGRYKCSSLYRLYCFEQDTKLED